MVEQRTITSGQSRADHLIVCISDVEMGAGGVLDDFPSTSFLAEIIRSYMDSPFDELAVDLVFNGDTFDFLKTSVDGAYPVHITAQIALAKLSRIMAAHDAFFDALTEFLRSAPRRRVFFTVGNHDQELLFPDVQRALRARIGVDDGLYFPGFSIAIGDALVEHGSQADAVFRVPPDAPFLTYQGERILNLPWGSVALLEATMPMQPVLYWADRLKPRRRVFDYLPEMREVLINAFWQYWTRDYWRSYMSGDPVKSVSWTMLKEVAYRFSSQDTDIGDTSVHQHRLMADERWRVRCIGHHHQPLWWSFGDRKLLVTGCYRDEYMVSEIGDITSMIPKVHAEIYQYQGRSIRSHLIELDGPRSEGAVPATLFERRPDVLALLGTDAERAAREGAQSAQEEEEAGTGGRRP